MKLKNIADISFNTGAQPDPEEVVETTLQPLPNNELVNQILGLGLAKGTADMLIDAFLGQYNGFSEIAKKVEGLVVTDEREVELMQQARSARLALRDIRLSADAIRKELKADALAYGNAVQGIYNTMLSLISPLEKKLKYEEEFKKRAEAERAAKELQRREELLSPYMPNLKYISLENMVEEEFELFLADQKAKFEAAAREAEAAALVEAARQAAAEKAAAEAAILEAERKAAVEAANRKTEIQAAVEAATREAEQKAAVEAATRKAEMEQLAAELEQLAAEFARQTAAREAEEAAQIAAEKAAAEAAILEAERKAAVEAAKGDKEKLLEWADSCKASTPKVGKQYERNVNELLNHIADFCEILRATK